jgi:hypothetical protein
VAFVTGGYSQRTARAVTIMASSPTEAALMAGPALPPGLLHGPFLEAHPR